MKRPLQDLCKIQYGFAFNSNNFSLDKGIPLVRIRDVVRGYSETFTTEIKNEEYYVNNGDILIGMDGEFNIARWKGGKAWLNQRVCKLIPNNEIDEGYLFYFMPSALKKIEARTPFVTVKHLSAKDLNTIEVPLPKMLDQRKIAKILDTVTNLIVNIEKQSKLLNTLIKARFVEMISNNPCRNDSIKNISIGKAMYGAQSASTSFSETRPRYVRITDINNNGTLNNDCVCSSNFDDDKEYKLEYGDFLFARMGATVGKTYFYQSGNQIFAGYLIRYKLNLDKINPYFLSAYTKTKEYWDWVDNNKSGAAQPGINAKKYDELLIPILSLPLQTQFAEFVQQVDKSKVVYPPPTLSLAFHQQYTL